MTASPYASASSLHRPQFASGVFGSSCSREFNQQYWQFPCGVFRSGSPLEPGRPSPPRRPRSNSASRPRPHRMRRRIAQEDADVRKHLIEATSSLTISVSSRISAFGKAACADSAKKIQPFSASFRKIASAIKEISYIKPPSTTSEPSAKTATSLGAGRKWVRIFNSGNRAPRPQNQPDLFAPRAA
jgi:hypothetical protein